jgi:hypothetical protein
MPPDSPGLDQARTELKALRDALDAREEKGGSSADSAHPIRAALQRMTAAMEGEVLKDSPYIAELGRILGMV